MAKPKKPKTPKPEKPAAAPKKTRKETREKPGLGHNLAELGDKMDPLIAKFLKLSEAMENDMAHYRKDFDNLYEKGANDVGLKKSVVTRELQRILKEKRRIQKEKEMAEDERQQTEMWRAAAAGTQFALFAEGDLASPEVGEEGAEEDRGTEEFED